MVKFFSSSYVWGEKFDIIIYHKVSAATNKRLSCLKTFWLGKIKKKIYGTITHDIYIINPESFLADIIRNVILWSFWITIFLWPFHWVEANEFLPFSFSFFFFWTWKESENSKNVSKYFDSMSVWTKSLLFSQRHNPNYTSPSLINIWFKHLNQWPFSTIKKRINC